MNALENSQEDIIPLLLADISNLTSNKQELLQYVNKFYQKIQEVSQAKDLKSVSTQALGKETLSEQNDTQAKDAVQQDIEQQLNQQKDKDNLSKESEYIMISMEYANAYTEVLEILKFIPKTDYNKIPQDMIKVFSDNQNKNYIFNYNPLQSLDDQNVSKKAKLIISILFRDYWAQDNQRAKILNKEKIDRMRFEEEKQEKYNVNNLFKNKQENLQNSESNTSLIEVKEKNFLQKIIEKIINLFRK